MNIFNSLGSNYDFDFVKRSLFGSSKKEDAVKLKAYLSEKYGGETVLTYKGREALRLALRTISKPYEYTVGICGFTCYAVFEAIKEEGYKVNYLDIEKDDLNFSAATLESAVKKNPKLKIVVVQNTLGYPSDIERILKLCREKSIILIEDLAHSVGAVYSDGKEAGTVGDFIVLSLSQDKMIDAEAGGALIVKNSNFKIHDYKLENVSFEQEFKDRFYPMFTVLIRKTYKFGIGKIIHFILKKANLLSTPVERKDTDSLYKLTYWHCSLILSELENLDNNIRHRRKIASIYSENLIKELFSTAISSRIDTASNLRFPIFVENRQSLINYLNMNNIFVSDIWYDAPIAPKKYLNKTDYIKDTCPNAEEISEKILNLPTHKNVSENDAVFITEKINLWMKSK